MLPVGLPCAAVPCTVTLSLTDPDGPRVIELALTCVAVEVEVGLVVVVVVDVVVVEVVDVVEVDVVDVDVVEEVDDVEDVDVVAPVVVVALVVVVVPPFTVVVVVGRVSVPKRMVPTARSPAWSPMAATQVSPAACWADVGGHGYSAASVSAFPDVVHPVMVDVDGSVCVQVGVPLVGGPTVPVFNVIVPDRSPLVAFFDEMVVMVMGEQLTGTSLPRKRITGCAGSSLHCSMEASEPGVNPVPDTVRTSALARPVQMGSLVLLLLHLAPAAVVEKAKVVVAAALLTTARLVVTRAPPARTATTPTEASRVVTRNRTTRRAPIVAMAGSLSPPFPGTAHGVVRPERRRGHTLFGPLNPPWRHIHAPCTCRHHQRGHDPSGEETRTE